MVGLQGREPVTKISQPGAAEAATKRKRANFYYMFNDLVISDLYGNRHTG